MVLNTTTETIVNSIEIELSEKDGRALATVYDLFGKLFEALDYDDELTSPLTGEIIEANEFSRMRGIIGCLCEASDEMVAFKVERRR